MSERRGLAFYKESGEPWTNEEFHQIVDYCGDATKDTISEGGGNSKRKFIYDQGCKSQFMWPWSDGDMTKQTVKEISYERTFNPTPMKKFKIK